MLQVSDVELPHTAISTNRGEDISLLGEVDVVDLLVVGDELGEDGLLLDVPDGAGGIDGAGADEVGELGVPVEGGQGCREVVVLAYGIYTFLRLTSSDTFLLSLILHILRHSPAVARRSGLSPFWVRGGVPSRG